MSGNDYADSRFTIEIHLDSHMHRVPLSFAILDEIEEELGGAQACLTQLQGPQWRVGMVLKLVHIMIAQNDAVCFQQVARAVFNRGAAQYRLPLIRYLAHAVYGTTQNNPITAE